MLILLLIRDKTRDLLLSLKKYNLGPEEFSQVKTLSWTAAFHSHCYAGLTPAQRRHLWHPWWLWDVPSVPPKRLSSHPHQFPKWARKRQEHEEDENLISRCASGLQTHVLLNLIILTWKSYWEGKGCFNCFNSFPSSLFLLFQNHLLSSLKAPQTV